MAKRTSHTHRQSSGAGCFNVARHSELRADRRWVCVGLQSDHGGQKLVGESLQRTLAFCATAPTCKGLRLDSIAAQLCRLTDQTSTSYGAPRAAVG